MTITTKCTLCDRHQIWAHSKPPAACSDCGGALTIIARVTTENLLAPHAREVPRA